jgi:diaminohydroxyphosphoribosylaminopyrimidine deaminase/5-amino-6-(5-phosphoribosylamino)uracil reductase
MQELGRLGINEILVEAGFKLNGSLLRAHLVDELLAYLAPHLLGESAHGMFSLPELTTLAHRHSLKIHDVRLVGKDMRILARPEGS